MDIREEIEKYRRANPYNQKIMGKRLLRVGTQMAEKIRKEEEWLEEAHGRLPMNRLTDTVTEKDEAREARWFVRYEEMMRLHGLRDMIEKEVLS